MGGKISRGLSLAGVDEIYRIPYLYALGDQFSVAK